MGERRVDLLHLLEDLRDAYPGSICVNRAHPAYRRALASRSIGYHIALAVGMSLASPAVEQAKAHQFVSAFLSCWGEALDKPAGRARAKSEAARP